MVDSTVPVRFGKSNKTVACGYTNALGGAVSEHMRQCALKCIEDELDLKAWDTAKAAFDADPEVFSAAEIAERYL